MLKPINLVLVAGLVFVGLRSTEASALISLDLVGGRSWHLYKKAKDSARGQDFGVRLYLDPIPLVPVGFGLVVMRTGYDKPSSYTNAAEDPSITLRGYEWSSLAIGPEVKAWLPIGDFAPFVRASYRTRKEVLNIEFATTGATSTLVKTEGAFQGGGLHYGGGLEINPIPFFSAYIEAERALESRKASVLDTTVIVNDVPVVTSNKGGKDNVAIDSVRMAISIGI